MRALTLKHPWPYAICRLGKRIENRTWPPSPKLLAVGDWLAIHGGAVPKGAAIEEAIRDVMRLEETGRAGRFLPIGEVVMPGIVAVCRFGGTVRESDDPWFNGPIGWLLHELVVLPEAVPCKGAQGLWELPPDALAGVRRQFRVAMKGMVDRWD